VPALVFSVFCGQTYEKARERPNKVVVYNAYYTASMIVKGIMFKISNSYAAKTKQLFRKYNELEKPEGWIAL